MGVSIWDEVEARKLEEYKASAERLNITIQEYLLLKIAVWCEDNK